MTKLSDTDKINVRNRIARGEREADLAREYEVSRQAINLIKHNHIGAGIGQDVSHFTREYKRNERIREVVDLANQGKTSAQIAKELGISLMAFYAFRRKFLPDLKVLGRAPYPPRLIQGRVLDYNRAQEMREDRRNGAHVDDLIAKYKVSKPTVYAVLSHRIWQSEYSSSRKEIGVAS